MFSKGQEKLVILGGEEGDGRVGQVGQVRKLDYRIPLASELKSVRLSLVHLSTASLT